MVQIPRPLDTRGGSYRPDKSGAHYLHITFIKIEWSKSSCPPYYIKNPLIHFMDQKKHIKSNIRRTYLSIIPVFSASSFPPSLLRYHPLSLKRFSAVAAHLYRCGAYASCLPSFMSIYCPHLSLPSACCCPSEALFSANIQSISAPSCGSFRRHIGCIACPSSSPSIGYVFSRELQPVFSRPKPHISASNQPQNIYLLEAIRRLHRGHPSTTSSSPEGASILRTGA